MSSEQLTLADAHADAQPPAERPEWRPQARPKDECQHCGAHVSPAHRRVFGDDDGRVYACHECTDKGKMCIYGPGEPDDEPARGRTTADNRATQSHTLGGGQ